MKKSDINNGRITSKPHAYLQTMPKTPAMFQKDQYKTVRGVAPTSYPSHCVYGRTDSRNDGRTNLIVGDNEVTMERPKSQSKGSNIGLTLNSFTATGENNRLLQTDETAQSSHLDLRCLTFSLSTLHINVFPSDSLLKSKSRRQMSS